jgi:hypothetical protein
LREYPSATFILHQWNNEYNCYIYYCLHPASVLHNPNNKEKFVKGIESFINKLYVIGGDYLRKTKKNDNFPSHNPPKKTLWDKIDKDLLYRSQLETRYRPDEDGNIIRDNESLSLGNRKIMT